MARFGKGLPRSFRFLPPWRCNWRPGKQSLISSATSIFRRSAWPTTRSARSRTCPEYPMTNALHIFRKDVRHLWPHAAACVILMALAAILDPTYASRGQSTAYSLLAGFALPLACWNLIIAAIHEEKLPGDRQYWLTRPYSWKDLLAAKALFVVAFINLPLFAWHAAAFAAVGIPLGEHLPALLWRQVFFSAFYIPPVAALAAVTRNQGQTILGALMIVFPFGVIQDLFFARGRMSRQGVEWMTAAAVAAV